MSTEAHLFYGLTDFITYLLLYYLNSHISNHYKYAFGRFFN